MSPSWEVSDGRPRAGEDGVEAREGSEKAGKTEICKGENLSFFGEKTRATWAPGQSDLQLSYLQ